MNLHNDDIVRKDAIITSLEEEFQRFSSEPLHLPYNNLTGRQNGMTIGDNSFVALRPSSQQYDDSTDTHIDIAKSLKSAFKESLTAITSHNHCASDEHGDPYTEDCTATEFDSPLPSSIANINESCADSTKYSSETTLYSAKPTAFPLETLEGRTTSTVTAAVLLSNREPLTCDKIHDAAVSSSNSSSMTVTPVATTEPLLINQKSNIRIDGGNDVVNEILKHKANQINALPLVLDLVEKSLPESHTDCISESARHHSEALVTNTIASQYDPNNEFKLNSRIEVLNSSICLDRQPNSIESSSASKITVNDLLSDNSVTHSNISQSKEDASSPLNPDSTTDYVQHTEPTVVQRCETRAVSNLHLVDNLDKRSASNDEPSELESPSMNESLCQPTTADISSSENRLICETTQTDQSVGTNNVKCSQLTNENANLVALRKTDDETRYVSDLLENKNEANSLQANLFSNSSVGANRKNQSGPTNGKAEKSNSCVDDIKVTDNLGDSILLTKHSSIQSNVSDKQLLSSLKSMGEKCFTGTNEIQHIASTQTGENNHTHNKLSTNESIIKTPTSTKTNSKLEKPSSVSGIRQGNVSPLDQVTLDKLSDDQVLVKAPLLSDAQEKTDLDQLDDHSNNKVATMLIVNMPGVTEVEQLPNQLALEESHERNNKQLFVLKSDVAQQYSHQLGIDPPKAKSDDLASQMHKTAKVDQDSHSGMEKSNRSSSSHKKKNESVRDSRYTKNQKIHKDTAQPKKQGHLTTDEPQPPETRVAGPRRSTRSSAGSATAAATTSAITTPKSSDSNRSKRPTTLQRLTDSKTVSDAQSSIKTSAGGKATSAPASDHLSSTISMKSTSHATTAKSSANSIAVKSKIKSTTVKTTSSSNQTKTSNLIPIKKTVSIPAKSTTNALPVKSNINATALKSISSTTQLKPRINPAPVKTNSNSTASRQTNNSTTQLKSAANLISTKSNHNLTAVQPTASSSQPKPTSNPTRTKTAGNLTPVKPAVNCTTVKPTTSSKQPTPIVNPTTTMPKTNPALTKVTTNPTSIKTTTSPTPPKLPVNSTPIMSAKSTITSNSTRVAYNFDSLKTTAGRQSDISKPNTPSNTTSNAVTTALIDLTLDDDDDDYTIPSSTSLIGNQWQSSQLAKVKKEPNVPDISTPATNKKSKPFSSTILVDLTDDDDPISVAVKSPKRKIEELLIEEGPVNVRAQSDVNDRQSHILGKRQRLEHRSPSVEERDPLALDQEDAEAAQLQNSPHLVAVTTSELLLGDDELLMTVTKVEDFVADRDHSTASRSKTEREPEIKVYKKKYQCTDCKRRFRLKSWLANHKCGKSGRSTSRKRTSNKHISESDDSSTDEVEVEREVDTSKRKEFMINEVVTSNRRSSRRQVESVTEVATTVQCSKCQQSFKDKSTMGRHKCQTEQLRKHLISNENVVPLADQDDYKYKCKICLRQYKLKKSWVFHTCRGAPPDQVSTVSLSAAAIPSISNTAAATVTAKTTSRTSTQTPSAGRGLRKRSSALVSNETVSAEAVVGPRRRRTVQQCPHCLKEYGNLGAHRCSLAPSKKHLETSASSGCSVSSTSTHDNQAKWDPMPQDDVEEDLNVDEVHEQQSNDDEISILSVRSSFGNTDDGSTLFRRPSHDGASTAVPTIGRDTHNVGDLQEQEQMVDADGTLQLLCMLCSFKTVSFEAFQRHSKLVHNKVRGTSSACNSDA